MGREGGSRWKPILNPVGPEYPPSMVGVVDPRGTSRSASMGALPTLPLILLLCMVAVACGSEGGGPTGTPGMGTRSPTASFSPQLPSGVTTIVYVMGQSALCADTGDGSRAQPFCHIQAAALAAVPGEAVRVMTGTYQETVTVAVSGTAGAPILFLADKGVTVTDGINGFDLHAVSWITVQGFRITHTLGDGISVEGGQHVSIIGNDVSFAGMKAPGQTASAIDLASSIDPTVTGNVVGHNSDSGIFLGGGTSGATVSGNVTFENAQGYRRAAVGIDVRDDGNTIEGNVSHDNEDSGIQVFTGAEGNVVRDNVVYHNGDHGIDVVGAAHTIVTSNSIYANSSAGINLEKGSIGCTVANNIDADNGISSSRTAGDIRVEASSIPGTELDYDLVYLGPAGTVMFIWGALGYASLAGFLAATGQEAHGIQAPPGWVAPSAGNFHLRANSAAIDSANSAASGESTTDSAGNARTDDRSVRNTGAGPRAFDDRGAYEFLG